MSKFGISPFLIYASGVRIVGIFRDVMPEFHGYDSGKVWLFILEHRFLCHGNGTRISLKIEKEWKLDNKGHWIHKAGKLMVQLYWRKVCWWYCWDHEVNRGKGRRRRWSQPRVMWFCQGLCLECSYVSSCSERFFKWGFTSDNDDYHLPSMYMIEYIGRVNDSFRVRFLAKIVQLSGMHLLDSAAGRVIKHAASIPLSRIIKVRCRAREGYQWKQRPLSFVSNHHIFFS